MSKQATHQVEEIVVLAAAAVVDDTGTEDTAAAEMAGYRET